MSNFLFAFLFSSSISSWIYSHSAEPVIRIWIGSPSFIESKQYCSAIGPKKFKEVVSELEAKLNSTHWVIRLKSFDGINFDLKSELSTSPKDIKINLDLEFIKVESRLSKKQFPSYSLFACNPSNFNIFSPGVVNIS